MHIPCLFVTLACFVLIASSASLAPLHWFDFSPLNGSSVFLTDGIKEYVYVMDVDTNTVLDKVKLNFNYYF